MAEAPTSAGAASTSVLAAAPGRGSGGDREDGSGPLCGTFSGGDDGAVYGGFFTLQHLCSINPNPSSQMLSAISSLFTNRRPGSTIFLPEVTGRMEVAPFVERFLAVMTGLFTEVSSRCNIFAPSTPTPPLRCCPQSLPFSRTAARGLQFFLGTLVLSSMASLPRIASTTAGSRARGSGISCLETASVRR